MSEWYSLIEARRAERKAYADSVEARFREFAVGKTTVADFLLEAQRRLATAQVKEYEAIAEYNIALSSFEYRKGNIMRHNNVVIAEGALPVCAEVRAVDHEQERARTHILRERPTPLGTPARLAGQVGDLPRELNVPSDIPQMVTPNFSQTKTSPEAPAANAGPNFGPGVSMVQPVDGTPMFRSVPAGPVSSAPEIVNRPADAPQPSMTANGLTSTVAPLRATPRN